jgi:hypothetical protein
MGLPEWRQTIDEQVLGRSSQGILLRLSPTMVIGDIPVPLKLKMYVENVDECKIRLITSSKCVKTSNEETIRKRFLFL